MPSNLYTTQVTNPPELDSLLYENITEVSSAQKVLSAWRIIRG